MSETKWCFPSPIDGPIEILQGRNGKPSHKNWSEILPGRSDLTNALDLAVGYPSSQEIIRAMASGTIILVQDGNHEPYTGTDWTIGLQPGHTNVVIVLQDDDHLLGIYSHFNEIVVTEGQNVNSGNVLGRITSGTGWQGPGVQSHLHVQFTNLVDGRSIPFTIEGYNGPYQDDELKGRK